MGVDRQSEQATQCWHQGRRDTARINNWTTGSGSRMPYVLVKENYFKWWIKVEGLNHTEIRHLAEKIGEQPESHQIEPDKLAEFSVPSWLVLNGLEQLGYRVVSSSQYVTGQGTFDIKDFVWTLYKNKEDWDHSS